tara:strand:- start:139 stop:606 length:468 start_codon:yes stop_codon:yes gene_type:complete
MIYSVDCAHFKTFLCSNAPAESQSNEADALVLPYEEWLTVLMKTDELKDPNHFTQIRKHAEELGVLEDEDDYTAQLDNPAIKSEIVRELLEGIKSSINIRGEKILNLQDYVGRQPQLIPTLMEDKDAVPLLVELLQDNSRVQQQVGSQYSCLFFL